MLHKAVTQTVFMIPQRLRHNTAMGLARRARRYGFLAAKYPVLTRDYLNWGNAAIEVGARRKSIPSGIRN
jgi:hypothetical protein